MKTLIVDDEPIARRVTQGRNWNSIRTLTSRARLPKGKKALLKIAELRPDLVFLDLQMPVMSGFEVIRNLTCAPPPVIVIVTAFDQHAIRAFEAGAIDYLLKPVQAARLGKSVERAKSIALEAGGKCDR